MNEFFVECTEGALIDILDDGATTITFKSKVIEGLYAIKTNLNKDDLKEIVGVKKVQEVRKGEFGI